MSRGFAGNAICATFDGRNWRFPLIIAGPGVTENAVCDEFIYLHDLTPTVVGWAGAQPFYCSNAQFLVPVLSGTEMVDSCDDIYMVRHHYPYPYEQR
ncbi:MAG: hypothetical protein U9R48_02530 [Chloroflexota bacterium]|nr:hypothetical protein [Chloroflexota bacterium]